MKMKSLQCRTLLKEVVGALQVKRIHEYKRQLLNVLGIIWKYDQIKKMTPDQRAQVHYFLQKIYSHCHQQLIRILSHTVPLCYGYH